jgi:hypothetical protein
LGNRNEPAVISQLKPANEALGTRRDRKDPAELRMPGYEIAEAAWHAPKKLIRALSSSAGEDQTSASGSPPTSESRAPQFQQPAATRKLTCEAWSAEQLSARSRSAAISILATSSEPRRGCSGPWESVPVPQTTGFFSAR